MGRHTLTAVWARKRRLFGAGFAIVIGVAFLVATLVFGDAMRAGIGALFTEGNSGTDVLVRGEDRVGPDESGARGTFDEDLVDTLAGLPEVGTALPIVEGLAQVVGSDGTAIGGEGPPTFGANWLPFDRNPYRILDGRPPATTGEAVLDSGTADTGGLAVGDTATVLVPHPVTVTVVGIAELRSGASLGGVTYVWFDTDTAQELLLGTPGRVSAVNLTAAGDLSQEELASAARTVLPEGLEAITGAAHTTEQRQALDEDFVDFFETFLLVFAGIALLVGTFSIHNTLSILVAQRTRETALLRTIGASRRQVLTSAVVEAAVLGALASAAGLAAGLGLAYGLAALLDAAGFGVPTAALGLDGSTVAAGLIAGIAVTLVASVAPAIKAGRVAPLAALRDVAVDHSGSSWVRGVVGVAVAAAGVTVVVWRSGAAEGALQAVAIGALLTLAGMVLAGPLVARAAAGAIGTPLAAMAGHSGKLARRNAVRNPRRTASTASALMIGTAVVALFATFAASIGQTLGDIIDRSFTGDLVIEQGGMSGAGISPQLAPAVQALPEIEAATSSALAYVEIDGEVQDPLTMDGPGMARVADLDVVAGSIESAGPLGIAAGRDLAAERGWTIGTEVPVGFPNGVTETMTVRAIYADTSLFGDLLIAQDAWRANAGGRADDFLVLMRVTEGVPVDVAQASVASVAERFGAPAVQTAEEYLDDVRADLDQMLTLVYGLLGLAILIALLGIANTLSLSLHERTRELGLLRAVGQSRRQLRRTVRWESVIVAVFGTCSGLILGTFLGWGVMRAFAASEGIGVFVLPVPSLLVVVAAAVVAGVVAAWRPARRAARLDVLDAIAVA